ncbi:MAG TPA: hypothetical protein VNJ12_10045 [Candidatus Dormibacteraeota bacterium]|nr:hypothetical protein [Candidatus Dormibacteraeota bacterium]
MVRFALVATLLFAFALPQTAPVDPAKLPARDSHQGILVACDPYQNPHRARQAIGKENPLKAGVLPLEVYVRNSTRWPLAISMDKIRLEVKLPGSDRQQIEPLGSGDLATMILHPHPANVEVPRERLPLPLPRGNKEKKWRALRDRLESLSFPAAVVAPGATVHGFLYFDLGGRYDALRYAQLYVPELKFLGNSQSIMFFQAALSGAGPD